MNYKPTDITFHFSSETDADNFLMWLEWVEGNSSGPGEIISNETGSAQDWSFDLSYEGRVDVYVEER